MLVKNTEVRLVATFCACCGLPLRDEDSMSMGMGPVCRKRHGWGREEVAADWGKALFALGQECPPSVYDAVVAAFGDWTATEGETADDNATRRRDIKPALKAIIVRIANALENRESPEQVARYVLAVDKLGCRTLARHLAQGLCKRRDVRANLRFVHAHVEVSADDPSLFWIRMRYFPHVTNAIARSTTWGKRTFDRAAKSWGLLGTAKEVFEILRSAGVHIVTGSKGMAACAVAYSDPEPKERPWWPEPCKEADRMLWVDEHGAVIRHAIPGEPKARPGLEKVPLAFMAKAA